MSGAADWSARLRRRLGPDADEDVVRELSDHACDRYHAARAEGANAAEAAASVEREIDTWARDAEALRRRPSRPALVETPPDGSRLVGLGRDLRCAGLGLLRRPAHSLLVVLTMALGIGVTTALFSVVHGVLLAPLPWPEAERLVRLGEDREGGSRSWPWLFTSVSYRAWSDQPATVEEIAGWQGGDAVLTGVGEPTRLRYAGVTASLFRLLQARPLVGSLFAEADEASGDALLLSHGLWRERFEARADAVGRVVRLDGRPHRIVGVMPPGFAYPDREARAWAALKVPALEGEGVGLFSVVARLAPGATPDQAAREAEARAATAPRQRLLERALFGSDGAPRMTAVPLGEALTREVRPALLLLLAAVALLLATATANVAGLQLTAATARRRELAIRSAIGAGRLRLARLLLAENLLLGLAGGGAGLLLAAALHRVLPALLPPDFPRLDAIAVDPPVAAFALTVSLASGLAFGLLPALFAGRLRLTDVLAEDGGGSVGSGSAVARARAAILAGQMAVACVLLLGALQLGRSFFAQLDADRGYTTSRLLVAQLTLPDALYTEERRAQLLGALLERLAAVPGVERAALTNIRPLGAAEAVAAFSLGAGPDDPDAPTIHTAVRTVSTGYFEALGRRLVAGRFLDARDSASSRPALAVNRTFAERYLETPAVGTVLPLDMDDRPDWEVVGVVEDVRPARLDATRQPEVFFAAAQRQKGLATLGAPSLLVRTRQDPDAFAPLLRSLIREQDPLLVPNWIRPMDELLGESLARPRLYSTLVAGFAVAALFVAGIGLFGVLSYGVALRRREIGLRVALGARPGDIVRLIARRAVLVAAAGLVLGLALSLAGGRLVESLLWGVRPQDAPSVAAVALALALVAALAAALPALRAARIDPQRALRDG